MRAYDIIKKKRDGEELTKDEINFIIEGYTANTIEDYQVSALLMAIYLNKMNERETLELTKAIVESGDRVDLSDINGIKVDKHSTGGVADTTTLILGPMVAACDVPFVKMSGRGLGHTGGTLDKLDSIRGFNTELSSGEFISNSNKINLCICGQTANIAPADKKIYALRDVTATVDNLSLIASSVMSKKLALGSDGIVLDVKAGNGAFMKTIEDAVALSEEMVSIGTGFNKNTIALVTDMNQPLGNNIGNALEVREAVEILRGEHLDGDLYKLSLKLGEELLILAGKTDSKDEARAILEKTIENGLAYRKLIEMVELQGGDTSVIEDLSLLPRAEHIYDVIAHSEGYVEELNAEEIGRCSLSLGAGRETIDSEIDLSAGIVLEKRLGDHVKPGDLLARVHSNNKSKGDEVVKRLEEIFIIGEKPSSDMKLVYALVNKDGIEYY